MSSSYSAVATHTWDLDHRLGFKQSTIVYRSSDRNIRRTVEGALINLNNTFINNKGSTKEDRYTNTLICKTAKIRNYDNISATLRTAASPLSPQVSPIPSLLGGHDTGTYAVPRARQIPPEPPDDALPLRPSLRRSTRLRPNNNCRMTH